MTILVVEDSIPNAQLIQAVLDTQGYQSVIAVNGEDGLAFAAGLNPSLIVTDLRLISSCIDGWELIRQVRECEQCKHIPIIVTAVEVYSSDRDRALAAGANVYLSKPFSIEILREAVASLIGPAA